MKHRTKDLRFRLQYLLFRGFVGLLKVLPINSASRFCGFVATQLAIFTPLHRRALKNLAAAFPEWSDDQIKCVAKSMWHHTGKTFAETIHMQSIFDDRARFEIRNSNRIENVLKSPGALILVTLHLGNWEIGGSICRFFNRDLAGVYRPFRNPYIDRFLFAQRQHLYKGGLFLKQRKLKSGLFLNSASIAAVKALRSGNVLGLVCDQSDPDVNFTVPFFGLNAKFTPAPAILSRYLNSPIWIARCYRSSDNRKFIIDAEKLDFVPAKDRDQEIYNVTESMAKKFEEWIRETPDQWMWWQRRRIAE